MSKIINDYKNNLDKAWYNSSNIVYSECDDKDNELKVVRITFKDGRTYEYKDVKVNDYLMFREAQSQGKAFIKFIRPYENKRVENKDVEGLQKELNELQNPNEEEFTITLTNNKLEIIDNDKDKSLADSAYTFELDEETTDIFAQVFSILNLKFTIRQEKNDND